VGVGVAVGVPVAVVSPSGLSASPPGARGVAVGTGVVGAAVAVTVGVLVGQRTTRVWRYLGRIATRDEIDIQLAIADHRLEGHDKAFVEAAGGEDVKVLQDGRALDLHIKETLLPAAAQPFAK